MSLFCYRSTRSRAGLPMRVSLIELAQEEGDEATMAEIGRDVAAMEGKIEDPRVPAHVQWPGR